MADSLSSTVPTSSGPGPAADGGKKRAFGRTQTVHQLLGSGKVADLLMWRDWKVSLGIVAGVSVLWVLFEVSGFTLLTLLADATMLLVAGVFVWAQVASLLNKPPPPLPELALSEKLVLDVATLLRKEVNTALALAHSVALGKDYVLFFKVIAGLYVLSIIGGWFHFLTLLFIGFLAAFTVPVAYNKYEDKVDAALEKAVAEATKVYKLAEAKVLKALNKAPVAVNKKTE